MSFRRLGTAAEMRRLAAVKEIRAYLGLLERTKFLAPQKPDLEMDDLDKKAEEQALGW